MTKKKPGELLKCNAWKSSASETRSKNRSRSQGSTPSPGFGFLPSTGQKRTLMCRSSDPSSGPSPATLEEALCACPQAHSGLQSLRHCLHPGHQLLSPAPRNVMLGQNKSVCPQLCPTLCLARELGKEEGKAGTLRTGGRGSCSSKVTAARPCGNHTELVAGFLPPPFLSGPLGWAACSQF